MTSLTNMLMSGVDDAQLKWYTKWGIFPSESGFIDKKTNSVYYGSPPVEDLVEFCKECFPEFSEYLSLALRLYKDEKTRKEALGILDILEIRLFVTQNWFNSVRSFDWRKDRNGKTKLPEKFGELKKKYETSIPI